MNKQFYYTIVQDEKAEPKQASFNVDKVIRTVEYEPNKSVVLLDDFHEEQGKRPSPRANGKITMESFKETVYSSIYMNEEDSKRFREFSEVGAKIEVAA